VCYGGTQVWGEGTEAPKSGSLLCQFRATERAVVHETADCIAACLGTIGRHISIVCSRLLEVRPPTFKPLVLKD